MNDALPWNEDPLANGWKEHSQFHRSRVVNGKRLDYWPTKSKFQYDGVVQTGEVYKFIRSLHADRMADLLQELVDAPEVLEATNPGQISSSAEPPTDVARDAERLDWLDAQCSEGNGRHICCLPGGLRSAVDAARKRQGGE